MARPNPAQGTFFRKRTASGGATGWGQGAAGGAARQGGTASPAKRALRCAVTEAFVWDSIRGDFRFEDVSDRTDIVAEVKIGIAAMRQLNDLFDELDADSNGGVELKDFQALARSHEAATQVWDQFRTWCFQGMNVVDNSAVAIERREYMRAMKRDVKELAAANTVNPHARGLSGSTMGTVVPFMCQNTDAIIVEKVAWLRTSVAEYIESSKRLHRTQHSMPDFPDLGDVHDILFSIPLTAVAAEGLKELWQCFDKNGDGVISKSDFATEGELQLWSDLRANFDTDDDGMVSGQEFVDGFKQLVHASSKIQYDDVPVPLTDAIKQLTDFASGELMEHVDKVAVHCGFKKGKSGVEKYPDIKQVFGRVQVDSEIILKIEEIFNALDVDKSGRLEISDFLARVQEKHKAAKQYEALWKTFGTDQSIRITFIEFATKIISHAVAKPGVEIPSRKIEDQVKMINDHLNSRLLTECEDLKQYFGV